jgi:hypothetical protein
MDPVGLKQSSLALKKDIYPQIDSAPTLDF